MNKLGFAVIAASALGVSAPAMADNWYLSPAIGFVIADQDDFDLGPSLSLGAGYEVAEKWNLEVSLMHSNLETESQGDYRREAINVSGLYFPSGRDGEGFVPFALASIGAVSVDFANDQNRAPAAEIGAGVLKSTDNDALSLRAEVRYQLDFHYDKAAYNDDTFYGWSALVGAQLAIGDSEEPMPVIAEEEAQESIVLPAVTFPLDSAQLTRNARATLDEVANVLTAHPEMVVEVVGHADDTGPSDYNFTLSLKRTAAVTQYLLDAGISEAQLHQRGVGETRPVASNATDDGRQRNRRVEFHTQ